MLWRAEELVLADLIRGQRGGPRARRGVFARIVTGPHDAHPASAIRATSLRPLCCTIRGAAQDQRRVRAPASASAVGTLGPWGLSPDCEATTTVRTTAVVAKGFLNILVFWIAKPSDTNS